MNHYHDRAIQEEIEERKTQRIRWLRINACIAMNNRVCRCWLMMGIVTYGIRLERLVKPLLPDIDAIYRALQAKYAELTDPELTTV